MLTLADKGGGGVRQMLTLADKGGRWGLAFTDITDQNSLKWAKLYVLIKNNRDIFIILVIYCNFLKESWSFRKKVVFNMLTKLTQKKEGGWANADIG